MFKEVYTFSGDWRGFFLFLYMWLNMRIFGRVKQIWESLVESKSQGKIGFIIKLYWYRVIFRIVGLKIKKKIRIKKKKLNGDISICILLEEQILQGYVR